MIIYKMDCNVIIKINDTLTWEISIVKMEKNIVILFSTKDFFKIFKY